MKKLNWILIIGMFAVAGLTVGQRSGWAQGAAITGKVVFEGEAPTPQPINFGAERQCALMHGDQKPVNEELIVNQNGTLKWTLVYVKDGLAGTHPAPSTPVEIDQEGCIFSPHVAAAQAGQSIKFKNSDTLLHNIRTVSTANKVFNIAQPIQGMTTSKVFTEPEVGIQLKCDVHFWMVGYLHVLGSPFYAVTGDDGSFSIKDLPPGTYTIEAWHEKLGTQSQTVTVAGGEAKAIDFTFKKA